MTAVREPPPPDADDRAADLVLARLHLRLGSLGLARAELESLAGKNALDDAGIRDLAEARWRTGDLPGAAEAAAAYLDLVPDDVLGLVITAELQSHLGRPADARRTAGRALARVADQSEIDEIFSGMPRSPVWPVEPGAPIEPVAPLFDDLVAPPPVPGAERRGGGRRSRAAEEPLGDGRGGRGEAAAPGLWEHHGETAAPVLPDPGELLVRARAALGAERPGQAAASLALALRAEPSLAPAVLDLIAGRSEPVLALVRGDAHRIVGHETEALRDYVAAVAAIGLERSSDEERRRRSDDEVPARPDASGWPRHGDSVRDDRPPSDLFGDNPALGLAEPADEADVPESAAEAAAAVEPGVEAAADVSGGPPDGEPPATSAREAAGDPGPELEPTTDSEEAT